MESLFERLLREKLKMAIDVRVQAMTVTGYSSFDEYRYNLGYIEAMRHAIDAIDATQDDMRKE